MDSSKIIHKYFIILYLAQIVCQTIPQSGLMKIKVPLTEDVWKWAILLPFSISMCCKRRYVIKTFSLAGYRSMRLENLIKHIILKIDRCALCKLQIHYNSYTLFLGKICFLH